MRATKWAAAGALGWWVGMTGCGSSSDSLAPMRATQSGDDAGGSADDAGAASVGPQGVGNGAEAGSAGDAGDASSNGGSLGSAADGGPPPASPGDSGAGDAAGDGSSDAGSGGGDAGSPCSGGKALAASDAPGVAASSEYAAVKWSVSTTTQLVGLKTTLIVPAKPTATSGTLYVWPGIQPLGNSTNYQPIGNGILQPVLSVGPTCAPGSPTGYTSWWISGQYVNVSTGAAGPSGCLGGDGMNVAVDDQLDISMTLSGTVWTQVVADRQSGKSVHFDMDLKGQGQNWATLAIEIPSALKPVSDAVFTSTQLTFAASNEASCQPSQHGPNDYFATPYASQDGKSCCVSRVVLRANGVAATTTNGP